MVGSDHACLLLTCGDQFGRTSAPIIPHTVQTIRPHSDRTGRRAASFRYGLVAGIRRHDNLGRAEL
jgi:hypothetical protein